MFNICKYIKSSVLISALALLFVSCVEKDREISIFGSIPTIYENEILAVTKQAQAQSDGNNEKMMRYMMDRADSVYAVAERKSLGEVKSMIGKTIPFSLEQNLGYTIKGDVGIIQVELPKFKSNGGEQKLRVMFNAEFENASDTIYYIVSGNDSIDYGFGLIIPEQKIREQTIIGSIGAPNIPAEHQMNCERLKFVSPATFEKSVPAIRSAQRKWRDAYYEENNINQESN